MEIINYIKSIDGITTKFIQRTFDNFFIETTLVERSEKNLICFSSQIGCPLKCYFCASSLNKFERSLNIEELVKQCVNVYNKIENKNKSILFSCMGIGEPLLNIDFIMETFYILNTIYNNPKFAISTVGLLYNLYKFIPPLEKLLVKLQLSVHAPLFNPSCLIKIKNSLLYPKNIELNYILIKNLNDSNTDAKNLSIIAKDFKVKINRFNKINILPYEPSDKIEQFINILKENNIKVEYYETNGSDINAACGQLQYSIRNNHDF